jgi:hypothetical protein
MLEEYSARWRLGITHFERQGNHDEAERCRQAVEWCRQELEKLR